MLIPLKVLQEALNDYGKTSLHADPDQTVCGIRLHGGPRSEKRYAYWVRGEDADDQNDPRILIIVGTPKCPSAQYLQVEAQDPVAAFTALQALFEKLQALEAEFSVMEAKMDYTRLLQAGEHVIGNAIRLFDQNHHLHATSNPSIESDTINFASSLQQLNSRGDLEYTTSLRVPTICSIHGSCVPSIVANIFIDSQRRGHILVVCRKQKPSELSLFVCARIIVHIKQMIVRDKAFGYIRMDDPLYNMLYHLLTGSAVSLETLQALLQEKLGWKSGYYLILWIQNPDAFSSFSYLSHQLGQICSSTCVLVQKSMCCILHIENWLSSRELAEQLRPFLLQNRLQAGLSCLFQDCSDIPFWAEQAKVIAEDSRTELGTYEEHQIQLISKSLSVEQKKLLVPSLLEHLVQLDASTGSSYYETLEAWFANGFVLDLTAKALYIHRNTLRYRLEHLKAIAHSDFSDPSERLSLQLGLAVRRALLKETQSA